MSATRGSAFRQCEPEHVLPHPGRLQQRGQAQHLDSYAGYRTGGSISASGAAAVPLQYRLDRGPTASLFANRSFIAKYLTSYYGSELSGDKSRIMSKTLVRADLGIMGTLYIHETGSAQTLSWACSTDRESTISWNNKINIIGRVESGRAEGFRAAASCLQRLGPGMLSWSSETGYPRRRN